MKIRNGFVSNSSSSSFVVNNKQEGKYKVLRSQKEIDILLQEGFVGSNCYHPMIVECNGVEDCTSKAKIPRTYILSVICNQDDIIEMLHDNKIPFTAFCHYGEELVAYGGGNGGVFQVRNFDIDVNKITNADPRRLVLKTNIDEIDCHQWQRSYYFDSALVVYLDYKTDDDTINLLKSYGFKRSFCYPSNVIFYNKKRNLYKDDGWEFLKRFDSRNVFDDIKRLVKAGIEFQGSLFNGECKLVYNKKDLFLIRQLIHVCWDYCPSRIVNNIRELSKKSYLKSVAGQFK